MALHIIFIIQVGNGCVGNEVGGCGHETGLKIHVEFYHGHALFSDVSTARLNCQTSKLALLGLYKPTSNGCDLSCLFSEVYCDSCVYHYIKNHGSRKDGIGYGNYLLVVGNYRAATEITLAFLQCL